jgi:hypothetical protein
MACTYFLAALIVLSCVSCVLSQSSPWSSGPWPTDCDKNKTNPVSGPVGNIWTVDPFIIPPKGNCNQMPVNTAVPSTYLRMDFDAYPDITAQCDDQIKFVMRTINRQQRHGVYLTDFSGSLTANSVVPCPPAVRGTDSKKCQVRLNESHVQDTQCPGYTQLDPLIMFGPSNTLTREYTTPKLRTLVAAGKESDTLVFTCPWVQGGNATHGTMSHCTNGMFVRVTVKGCTVSCCALWFEILHSHT